MGCDFTYSFLQSDSAGQMHLFGKKSSRGAQYCYIISGYIAGSKNITVISFMGIILYTSSVWPHSSGLILG